MARARVRPRKVGLNPGTLGGPVSTGARGLGSDLPRGAVSVPEPSVGFAWTRGSGFGGASLRHPPAKSDRIVPKMRVEMRITSFGRKKHARRVVCLPGAAPHRACPGHSLPNFEFLWGATNEKTRTAGFPCGVPQVRLIYRRAQKMNLPPTM